MVLNTNLGGGRIGIEYAAHGGSMYGDEDQFMEGEDENGF